LTACTVFANLVQAGDVIQARGGPYPATYEYMDVTTGIAAAPITLQPHPGETSVLDTTRARGGAVDLEKTPHAP
jgi:hypothetical protein